MTIAYEEALEASLDYFDGDDLAATVWIDKYSLRDNNNNILEKTPQDMHWRIAKEFARIEEKKFKKPLSKNEIFKLIDKFKYIIPQGSPMYGIGNEHQIISLSNCYLADAPLDSYSGILFTDEQLVNISKRRGGVGVDLDNLRPTDFLTHNASRSSTGMASWMRRYSNSIREVGQNGRRGALMLTLNIHHPDILLFCTIKNNPNEVTGANISVKLTREFVTALKNDTDYELRWPLNNPTYTKKISAKLVWDTIINSAWLRAEPGILAWYNTIENCPADCYENYKSSGTNPCSEINLSYLDSCRLLCLNLYSYVSHPFTTDTQFNFDLFYKHAQIAQRLMDDLVDLESEKIQKIIDKIDADPEPDYIKQREKDMWVRIKRNNDEGRRTGLGITALGDTLAALGLKYDSTQAIEMTDKIYRTLKLGAYRASVDMAKELGPFKEFDKTKEQENPFLLKIKDEDVNLYNEMNKYGRRNIALLTTAPTGTVSIMTQTTSGIEPVYKLSYTRRKKINHNDVNVKVDFTDQSGDGWQEFTVYHPKVKEWMAITKETDLTKSPWFNCSAEDINWINRVKLQAAAQAHVCHAISSTINVPEDITKEEIANIYLTAFEEGCKGITVYRENCRSGVLIAKKSSIVKTNAPKRPKSLPCEVHHISVKGQPYFVLVGLFDGEPYEVFAGKNGVIDKKVKTGTITKKFRRHYKAEFDDGSELAPITAFTTDEEDVVTRLISSNLRHGASLAFVVHQLEKSKGDLQSFSKSISRALKKYIKNGTEVKGEECPECNGKLFREEGCVKCKCGWTKCS